jgi:hypothetical protein
MVASEFARGFQDTAHQFRMTVMYEHYSNLSLNGSLQSLLHPHKPASLL